MTTLETSEKRIIRQYLDLCKCFHFHLMAGIGSYLGSPDIIAALDGKAYAIEVKAGNGRQSDYQKIFQKNWEKAGCVYVLGGIEEVRKVIKLKNEQHTTKTA